MIVYFGETVTVQVQGQTWRGEKCEHCREQFFYPVTAVATGVAINPYFLDSSSSQRAETDAHNQLARALKHDVVPIPCPHCTKYQGYMLPAIRETQFLGVRTVGRLLLVLLPGIFFFLGCLLLGLLKDAIGGELPVPAAIAVMLGLPVLSMFVGVGVLSAWRRKQAQYDPNAPEYTDARRQMAADLALKPEEFTRLGVSPPPLNSPVLPRGQLVNQNCVRCGQRIPDELDSQFCQGCGSPVHNRCAVPSEGGCKVCGASAT